MFDEETETLAARARARGGVPAGRTPPPDGLQDRDHAARQRGRRAERAQHDGAGEHLPGGARPGARRRPRRRPRDPDALRRLGPDDVLRRERGRLEAGREEDRGPGPQGDEADRPARVRDRGRDHPSRHVGGPADGGADRVPGADPVRRRLVRQRRVPRRADRAAAAPGPRADRRDGRAPAQRGVSRVLRAGLPRGREHRRDVAGRAEPARDRSAAASRTSRRSPTATCRCSCSTCWSSWTSTTRSTSTS